VDLAYRLYRFFSDRVRCLLRRLSISDIAYNSKSGKLDKGYMSEREPLLSTEFLKILDASGLLYEESRRRRLG
jgi:hypothetical protein